MALNLETAFLASKAVAPIMMTRNGGSIINIASAAGIAPNPYAASYIPYGAAKAGLIGFTKLLARDLGAYGIAVDAVSPGTTLTPRVAKVRDAQSLERIATQNPMKCLVEPQDSAEEVVFLAPREACHIRGIYMSVNAGSLM